MDKHTFGLLNYNDFKVTVIVGATIIPLNQGTRANDGCINITPKFPRKVWIRAVPPIMNEFVHLNESVLQVLQEFVLFKCNYLEVALCTRFSDVVALNEIALSGYFV